MKAGQEKGRIEEKTRSSLKNLLRWKRLFPSYNGLGENAKLGILDQLEAWTNAESYIKNAQKAIFGAQSYALIVYGTRTCK